MPALVAIVKARADGFLGKVEAAMPDTLSMVEDAHQAAVAMQSGDKASLTTLFGKVEGGLSV